jgi:hypothetical protein
LMAFLTFLPSAFGQDFTMTVGSFNPFAVDLGEASSATIGLTALNGFNGFVDLTCAITSDTSGTPPICQVSPISVQPSGGATITITTTGSTTPATYKIAITGTSTNTTIISPPVSLTVLPVTPQFTITVQTTVAPSSVPAGSGAQGVISINPINGYISPTDPNDSKRFGITLSCASISPLVAFPPVCSFNPQPVPVNGTPKTSTITINTAGPITTGTVATPRSFYGLWIPLPLLALAGLGAAAGGKRSRKVWGLLALFIMSASLLLMPACGNSNTSSTTPNGITPVNTYTFTIVGVDIDGNISSNTSSSGTNPSVSLAVTAPSKVP